MGIRDREICNGTTGYFGPSVERGHRLFWRFALRGHGLFQCRISAGPKIILMYCSTGSWTIFNFFWSFSYRKYGTRANLYYGAKTYFGRRFQRGRGKFLTKQIWGHIYTILYGNKQTVSGPPSERVNEWMSVWMSEWIKSNFVSVCKGS